MSEGPKYRLGERLGRGGMAEVFRAEHRGAEGFSRPVAVKQMLPALSAEPEFEAMFRNEAQLAARLHHPNVVSIFDFDRDPEGRLFIAMELVEGSDLRHLMDAGRVPAPLCAHIAAQLLEALAYAHDLEQDGRRLGLVHRDVTPHNVLLTWDGHVKLSDFGIAKAVERTSMTATGVLKGKVAYMSPEQIEGTPLDGRSDLFALGIILHEMLVGRPLFRGDGAPDRVVLNRILIGPIEPPHVANPDVPEALSAVCMGLLERDLSARFADAHAALDALLATDLLPPHGARKLRGLLAERRRTMAAEPVEAPPPPRPDRADTRPLASPMQAEPTRPSEAWHAATSPNDTRPSSPRGLEAPPEPTQTPPERTASERPHITNLTLAPVGSDSRRLGWAAAALAVLALALSGALWARNQAGIEVEPVIVESAPTHAAAPTPAPAPAPEARAEPATPRPEPTADASKAQRAPRRGRAARKARRPVRGTALRSEAATVGPAPTESPPRETEATPPKAAPAPRPKDTTEVAPKPPTPAPGPAPVGDDILAPSFD